MSKQRKKTTNKKSGSNLPDFEIYEVEDGFKIRTRFTKQPIVKIDADALGLSKWQPVMSLTLATQCLDQLPHKSKDPVKEKPEQAC